MEDFLISLTKFSDTTYYVILGLAGLAYAWSAGWLGNLVKTIDDKIDLPDFTPDEEEEVDWELEYFQALRLLLSEVEEGVVQCPKYTKALRDAADHFLNRHEPH